MSKIHLIGETKKEQEHKLLEQSLDLLKENSRLSQEVLSATNLIWAMAESVGGEIRIRDDLMASMGSIEASISSRYDAQAKETVVIAVTKERVKN